ncbi:unnamed protein product [marine sediment metagenome]|uniref:Uncharacterized protein n=1 Tax=marine sediment metagenome TaxID=412755 RepID=X1PU08_9ZZZZ
MLEGLFLEIASMETVEPVVRDFILFCIQRQGKEWPSLYDEMCWVAGRRLFRGLSYTDLRKLGLSFSLTNIEDTIRMVDTVVAQSRIATA